jgi:hypothetical protein
MAGRGSLVGDAYIRVHADTRFMERELRRDAAAAARASGDDYTNDFSKRIFVKRKEIHDSIRNALAEALVTGDFDRIFKKSGKTIDEFSRITENHLRKIARQGRITQKDLNDALLSLERWAGNAKAIEKMRLQAAEIKNQELATRRLNAERIRQERIGAALAKSEERLHLDRVTRNWQTLTTEIRNNDLERHRLITVMRRHGVVFEDEARRLVTGSSRFSRAARNIRILTHETDRFSLLAGRAFGKGSRNNFFNFFGTLIQGATKFGLLLPITATEKFTTALGNML